MENMIAKDWSLFMSRQGGGGGKGRGSRLFQIGQRGGGLFNFLLLIC